MNKAQCIFFCQILKLVSILVMQANIAGAGRVGRASQRRPSQDQPSHFFRKIRIRTAHVYSGNTIFSSLRDGNPETKFDKLLIANFLFLTFDQEMCEFH